MQKNDRLRLEFIKAAAEYISTLNPNDNTKKNQYAVLLNLVTLAEAACKIGKEIRSFGRDLFNPMPWRELNAIRVFVHEHQLLDSLLPELYIEAIQDAPLLLSMADNILETESNDDSEPVTFLSNILNKLQLAKQQYPEGMPKKSNFHILARIKEELDNIQLFLASDNQYQNNQLADITLYAVEMAFAFISNEIKKEERFGTGLEVDFMKQYPLNVRTNDQQDLQLLVTWGELLELGNTYIHNYFNISTQDVINFCQIRLPILKERIDVIAQHCEQELTGLLRQKEEELVTDSTYQRLLASGRLGTITPGRSQETEENLRNTFEEIPEETIPTPSSIMQGVAESKPPKVDYDRLLEELNEEYEESDKDNQKLSTPRTKK